ncbi:MAG TPA: transglycosylase SLT domain-containing protein [Ktedonobacterales bacterium]
MLRAIHTLWRRATSGSWTRKRIIGIAGASVLLLIALALVVAALAPDATPKQEVLASAKVTATATDTATPSPSPSPTAKPTVRPASKPVPKTPPPPPIPTAPPSNPPTPAPSNAYTGGPVTNDSIFSQFCSTSTPTPSTGGTSSAGSNCLPCPSYTSGYNNTQSEIAAALAQAASMYNLPVNLVKAVAWQESKWHEDVYSCDGGIGLMQIQYYVYNWLNQESTPACSGINATNYDPYTLQGNANLGAKYLAYLGCYYSYWGGYDYDINGNLHSLSNPSKYTVDWYYLNATPPLRYPDTLNADGTTNANSLCASVYNANGYYPALPSSTNAPWGCPYSATAGDTTLLDITISAYNEGPGNINKYGINNMWYVNSVEGFIPQFASGALP